MSDPLFAGVELGGTKSIAVVARGYSIIDRIQLPTTTPAPTLDALSGWLLRSQAVHGDFAAIGIGSFGPVCVDHRAAEYGWITNTPKPGWADTSVLDHFRQRFHVPIGFDTDVNGAALAEGRWGASREASVHVYMTIGTGVGVGIVVDGRPLHGAMHPEFGHIRIRRLPGDSFPGVCRFHGDCLEGLISGPAIAARTGDDPSRFSIEHPVWEAVAADLAEAVGTLILTVSPQKIVIGGGVAVGQPRLFEKLPPLVAVRLAGYYGHGTASLLDEMVCRPGFGNDAGPLGAIALAFDAL